MNSQEKRVYIRAAVQHQHSIQIATAVSYSAAALVEKNHVFPSNGSSSLKAFQGPKEPFSNRKSFIIGFNRQPVKGPQESSDGHMAKYIPILVIVIYLLTFI